MIHLDIKRPFITKVFLPIVIMEDLKDNLKRTIRKSQKQKNKLKRDIKQLQENDPMIETKKRKIELISIIQKEIKQLIREL